MRKTGKLWISLVLAVGLIYGISVKAFAGLKEVTEALGKADYALVISEADKALATELSPADKGQVMYLKSVANYNTEGKPIDNVKLLQDAKAAGISADTIAGIAWFAGLAKYETPAEEVAIMTDAVNQKGVSSYNLSILIPRIVTETKNVLKQPAPQDLLKKLFVECPAAWEAQASVYQLVDWKTIDRAERLAIFQNVFEAIDFITVGVDKDGNAIPAAIKYKATIGNQMETLKIMLR